MERLAGRVILLWGWRRALLAVVAGALASLGHAPFDFFAICFVSFTLLVWLLDGVGGGVGRGVLSGWRTAFAIGWWFGFGYFLAGLYWVGNALLVEAENFAWALPFAILVLPAILAAFYGLATMLARLLWSDGIGRIAALALAFGGAEWLRSFLFTGFPWNAIGYAAMPVPMLMQSVTVVGTFAMSALAVFVFAMPALAASRRHRLAGTVLAALLIAAHAGFGAWRLSQAETASAAHLNVRIVQPSIDQSEKWDQAARDRIFAKLLDLSALPPDEDAERPEIILWPETSLPFLLSDRPDALTALADLLGDDQKLLAGAVRVEGTAAGQGVRYYNSILHVSDEGEIVDGYDKVHLVPFGEYLPFADGLSRLGVQQIVSSFPAFAAGARRHTLEIAEGVSALPFICYEIIFPGAGEPLAGGADLILNVTNDAWFGNSAGPYQHFRQSQIRAVELGLPLMRAANNGISGVVDAHGRVVDAFAMDAVGVLDVDVPLVQARPGGARGDLFSFALLALLALAMAIASLRRIDR